MDLGGLQIIAVFLFTLYIFGIGDCALKMGENNAQCLFLQDFYSFNRLSPECAP